MAGASLLTLLDDITTVLDDIAVMSKVAAKKTAGVLGDDLALNAQQVSGVSAEREIPVVLAVAKGSLRNKAILVPAALLLSAFVPWIIMPLLLLGGLYLSYEGAEKVTEKLFHPHTHSEEEVHADPSLSPSLSVDEYEKIKVAGAIRTDFILSAEIIVIAMGTVQGQSQLSQILVVSFIALIMTIGVYGLVAGIVKLDDLGFYLERKSGGKGAVFSLGQGLIMFAPKLMKMLTIVGTLAMFLVGGGIVEHNVPPVHHLVELMLEHAGDGALSSAFGYTLNGVIGLVAGLMVMLIIAAVNLLRGK